MIQASINGVVLMPRHDYIVEKDYVEFKEVPRMGDRIQIISKDHRFELYGNEFTYKYPIPQEMIKAHQLESLITDLVEYMDHPTVKDQLERLQVVIELVRKTG